MKLEEPLTVTQSEDELEPAPHRSVKEVLIALAKFAFAGIILYYLYHKGDIQLSKVRGSLAHWPALLAVAAITLFAYYTQGFRWLALLKGRGIELSAWNAFAYLMEGKFFNLIIPGYFSEDFMRGLYAIRTHKESRSKVIGSLLVDRSAGVFTMFLFGAAGLLLRSSLLSDRRLSGLFAISLLLMAATIAGILFLRMVERPPQFLMSFAQRLHLHIAIDRMYAEGRFYAMDIPLLLVALVYTLFNQGLMIWCFYLIGSTLGMSNVSVLDFIIFAPAGMLATILPVAPAGLGVGQLAFQSLFRFAGSEQGANLYSVYLLIVLSISLFGFVFYLQTKNK